MDIVTRQVRSRMMASVRSRDTTPEKIVRSTLHRLGYRFRLHNKQLPGTPDIVLPKYHSVVFVHGCFWHQHPGCKRSARPGTNITFWNDKLDVNVKRDNDRTEQLIRSGWKVLVVWECQTKDIDGLRSILESFLRSDSGSLNPYVPTDNRL